MRKATVVLLMVLGFLGFAGQSQAAESGTITVTVSLAEIISVSLDSSAWGIGAIALSSSDTSSEYTASNLGNVAIDLGIKAENGAGAWALGASADADQFRVEVTSPAISSLTTSDQSLATSVAVASGTQAFTLKYYAPTSDTKGPGTDQSFSITITASKS